jgi:DNA polymerase-3 subunit delta'
MIIGHQKQWQFLKKSAETNRLSHAYLFFGQERLGKKTLALEFIKFLNCQNNNQLSKPCQQCSSCKDIQKRQHPDLFWIEPVGKEIQISQIRNLQWRLSLRPFSAPFKAAIIDQAHCMNSEAQSCILKTLEEPSGKAILILITEYPELLFSTILSRVQKIRFSPVPISEIEDYLKKQRIPQEKKDKISFLSLSKPGLAIDFLLNPQKLEYQNQKVKEMIQIRQSDLIFRFQYIKDAVSKKYNIKELLDIWLRYFREILFKTLKNDQTEYSLDRVKNIINTIQNINFLISTTNVNQRLALEQLMLEI